MKKILGESQQILQPSQSQQSSEPFRHTALNAGQFRLLTLREWDNAWDNASQIIQAELRVVDTSTYEKPWHYETLSYVWGNAPADHEIRLNDHSLLITSSLWEALRVLARERAGKFLWVDAICINQKDSSEKSSQVRMMGQIYQRAQRVIIWINRPGIRSGRRQVDLITQTALKGFAQGYRAGWYAGVLTQYLENPRHEAFDKPSLESFRGDGGYWPALVRFFDQDWWRRVWVRQELAMSKKATVFCSEHSVDWEDVAAMAHWVSLFTQDLDEKTKSWGAKHRSGAYSGEDFEDFRQTLQRGGSLDLQSMLIHARNCETTDPRDRVFAVLGMVEDFQSIHIDYDSSPAEVAQSAFKALANANGGLEALIFSQNPDRTEGIPSWAPNISAEFSAQPSRLRGISSSLYAASGRSEHAKYRFDVSTLAVDVRIFDYSLEISQPFPAWIDLKDLDDCMRTLREDAFLWLSNLRTHQKYERLMRTLTRDQDIQANRLDRGGQRLDWAKFFRIEHRGVGAVTEFQYLSKAIRQFQTLADDRAESGAWLRVFKQSIGNRRMILTAEERIGLVPAATRLGDKICIMDGLDVPLVLRPLDTAVRSYVLIGEAYIHGAMDGEIDVEAETIVLE